MDSTEEYHSLIDLSTTGQSPIDLDDSIVRLRRFPPLIINGHWLNEGEARMLNNGKTAKIFLSGDRIPSMVSGGPLLSEYEFYEAHFHWAEENCNGAEHTINGTWFSMEAHVVHWNRKYSDFDECLNHKDGICVLAYLFLVQPGRCEWSNPQLDRITDNLKYIIDAGTSTKIPANSLCWMRSATSCPRYYTYPGSFNNGPDPECAIWIVFPHITLIRPCQVNEFRKLKDKNGECIKANVKKIQYLKGRKIFLAVP